MCFPFLSVFNYAIIRIKNEMQKNLTFKGQFNTEKGQLF